MRVYLRVRPFSKEELSDSQDQVGNTGPEGQVEGRPAMTLAVHRSYSPPTPFYVVLQG